MPGRGNSQYRDSAGWAIICWVASKVGFSYSHHQIADAAAAEGNLFNQASSASGDLSPPDAEFKVDAVCPRAALLMLLLTMVSVGLVLGATEPVTPNGEYSKGTMPPSPVSAVMRADISTPGVLSGAALF